MGVGGSVAPGPTTTRQQPTTASQRRAQTLQPTLAQGLNSPFGCPLTRIIAYYSVL